MEKRIIRTNKRKKKKGRKIKARIRRTRKEGYIRKWKIYENEKKQKEEHNKKIREEQEKKIREKIQNNQIQSVWNILDVSNNL